MGNFLKDLQRSLDGGEFNSEAANVINNVYKQSMGIDSSEGDDVIKKYNEIMDERAVNAPKPTKEEIEEAKKKYDEYLIKLKDGELKSKAMNNLMNKYFNALELFDVINENIGKAYLSLEDVDVEYNAFSEKYPELTEHFNEIREKTHKIIEIYKEFIMKYKEFVDATTKEVVDATTKEVVDTTTIETIL